MSVEIAHKTKGGKANRTRWTCGQSQKNKEENVESSPGCRRVIVASPLDCRMMIAQYHCDLTGTAWTSNELQTCDSFGGGGGGGGA